MSYCSRCAELEKQLEQARKDTERLNWLEALFKTERQWDHVVLATSPDEVSLNSCYRDSQKQPSDFIAATIREAIDAAGALRSSAKEQR